MFRVLNASNRAPMFRGTAESVALIVGVPVADVEGVKGEHCFRQDGEDGLIVARTIPRVLIESPLAGDVGKNLDYALKALEDSLSRGEAPFASHLLYPQVLDDLDPVQREQGMAAGFAWGDCADFVAVYQDRGISPGMLRGIERHLAAGIRVDFRTLGYK